MFTAVCMLALCPTGCPPFSDPGTEGEATAEGEGETAPDGTPSLGVNAPLNGARVFPADNPWNQAVDTLPVDPNSDALIDSIGRDTTLHPDFGANWDGGPFGIPYIVVAGDTPKVSVNCYYPDESDPGPYPVTGNAPIEGGPDSDGDRHVLMLDRDNWVLYELYDFHFPARRGAPCTAGSGAVFDLKTNVLRPAGWTSADAAGLPIFPGLVRYDEVVVQREIRHALRFTVAHSRRAYVSPARHIASDETDPNLPPMGMRVRLKAGYDISPFPEHVQVILRALRKYGMMVADNGSNWFISGAPDARWDDEEMNRIKEVPGDAFEVAHGDGHHGLTLQNRVVLTCLQPIGACRRKYDEIQGPFPCAVHAACCAVLCAKRPGQSPDRCCDPV